MSDLKDRTQYVWVSLSEGEKSAFVDSAKNCQAQHPTLFNFATDSKNVGGSFADLSNQQVIERATAAAKWLMAGAEV